jgi:hypothetical protein
MANRQTDRDGICFSEPLPLHGLWANRHAWALRESGELLAAALHKDTSAEAREVEKLPDEQIPAQVVRLILEKADPTRNKGMTAWLVRQYGQGRLRLEDLGTANETLMMFQRYAPRLGPGQRDLGRYPHLSAVWEAVIGFANDEEQHLSGKAQKALDRDKAYAESRILHQTPDGFTVAVPLTEFAAKWWGKGTRWCTAAEKENQFWPYHEMGPLIVFVIPELGAQGKFQLWISDMLVEFRDASDEEPDLEFIGEYWAFFGTILLQKVKNTNNLLRYIPVSFRSFELCDVALRENALALQYVPKLIRTKAMCEAAVAVDGMALQFVPEEMRSEQLCLVAVRQYGLALEFVPSAMRTEEICKIAISQDGHALLFVPDVLLTEEICRLAIERDVQAMRHVPQAMRTDEICQFAVSQSGRNLWYVPVAMRSQILCKSAVATYGLALESVPETLRTEDICRISVAQCWMALQYVPEALKTEEMCRVAVAQSGNALGYVPVALRGVEICRMAVSRSGWALGDVPGKLRDEEMNELALGHCVEALIEIPEEQITEKLCQILVEKHTSYLGYLPREKCTEDLCKIALSRDGSDLQHVPQELRTEELCRIALMQNGRVVKHVPLQFREALNHLVFVPKVSWSLEILDELSASLKEAYQLNAVDRPHV